MGTSYGPYPFDGGLIIPKLLNLGKDEQLIRLGLIEEYRGKDQYECPGCGNKFRAMNERDSHFRKRHGERRGAVVKNLEDLTELQKEIFRNEVATEYYASPQDTMVPDPEDSIIVEEERRAEETAPIFWDKTAASRK